MPEFRMILKQLGRPVGDYIAVTDEALAGITTPLPLSLAANTDEAAIIIDPSGISGNSAAANWYLNVKKGAIHAGNTLPNNKMTQGYNVDVNGVQLDPTKPAVFQMFDVDFSVRSGVPTMSYVIDLIDASGTIYCPMSFEYPQTGGPTGFSFGHIQVNKYGIESADGSFTQCFFNMVDDYIAINQAPHTTTKFRNYANNVPCWQQLNAAQDTILTLPYFDAGDVLYCPAAGVYMVGARAGAAATFPGSFLTVQPTTAVNNDVILTLQGATFTGKQYAFLASGAPTTGLVGLIENDSATGTAHADLILRSSGASGGDARVQFDISGVTTWVVGADNSDSDRFKIDPNGALSLSPVVSITTGGAVGFSTDPTAAWLTPAAGTTAMAQMNLPVSTAPSAPNDGDIWRQDNTNTGLKIRVNGVTKTITLS